MLTNHKSKKSQHQQKVMERQNHPIKLRFVKWHKRKLPTTTDVWRICKKQSRA